MKKWALILAFGWPLLAPAASLKSLCEGLKKCASALCNFVGGKRAEPTPMAPTAPHAWSAADRAAWGPLLQAREGDVFSLQMLNTHEDTYSRRVLRFRRIDPVAQVLEATYEGAPTNVVKIDLSGVGPGTVTVQSVRLPSGKILVAGAYSKGDMTEARTSSEDRVDEIRYFEVPDIKLESLRGENLFKDFVPKSNQQISLGLHSGGVRDDLRFLGISQDGARLVFKNTQGNLVEHAWTDITLISPSTATLAGRRVLTNSASGIYNSHEGLYVFARRNERHTLAGVDPMVSAIYHLQEFDAVRLRVVESGKSRSVTGLIKGFDRAGLMHVQRENGSTSTFDPRTVRNHQLPPAIRAEFDNYLRGYFDMHNSRIIRKPLRVVAQSGEVLTVPPDYKIELRSSGLYSAYHPDPLKVTVESAFKLSELQAYNTLNEQVNFANFAVGLATLAPTDRGIAQSEVVFGLFKYGEFDQITGRFLRFDQPSGKIIIAEKGNGREHEIDPTHLLDFHSPE